MDKTKNDGEKENTSTEEEETDEEEETEEEEDESEEDESDESEDETGEEGSSEDSDDESESTDEEEDEEEGTDDEDLSKLSKEELIKRVTKAEKAIVKNKKSKKEQKTVKVSKSDETTLARLEARGILESEDQQEVLEYMSVKKVDLLTALNSSYLKGRLSHLAKKRQQKGASIRPNKRTGVHGTDEVAKAVALFRKNGTVPTNPRLASKVLDALAESGG